MASVKAQEKSVTVNGVRLRYLDWGNEGKQPLVCFHGHTQQAHLFDEFAEAMSPYFHVYAVDQRGHGGSQWAADGYARGKFVADLGAFLDALSLQKVVLVGHSMGGWNSLLYTPDNQDRVDKIILIDISAEPSETSKQMSAARPPTPMEFATFEEAFAWARTMNPFATEERLRKDVKDRTRQREDGKWTWKADSALFNTPLRDSSDEEMIARYWKSLETITCPILEVRGTGSVLVSDEIIERMRKINPRISVVDIAGAGHNVSMDKPEEFIKAARGFLGV